MMTSMSIATTGYLTLLCEHAYGAAWLVSAPGIDLLVCGTKLPTYLAKRLDTAIDTGGVPYESPDERDDTLLYARAEFTAAEVARLRAADTADAERDRIEWILRRTAAGLPL